MTAPLFLHIVQSSTGSIPNHWVTLQVKKSIKSTLPTIEPEHYLKALSARNKPSGLKVWLSSLSFEKFKVGENQGEEVKAVMQVE
ncbi:hypothetical protein PS15p_206618 [Mucor circinelloides]